MKTKHTPGPWRYWTQRRPESEDTCTFRNLDGAEILRAVTVTLTESDARLIAAAPELLAALEELVNAYIGDVTATRAPEVIAARAAIAKATGA